MTKKKNLFSCPVWGKLFSIDLWASCQLLVQNRDLDLWVWRAAKNMKPAPISQGHQKAVNWLDTEQQLFDNNCPPYLHPVPVPGLYNGSMYPKCLYPDEPGATQFKRFFFPSSGMAKKKIPTISFLFCPGAGAQKGQPGMSGRREATAFMIFILQKILELQGGSPDSFPGTASWNANAEKPCFAQRHMCSHTHA